LRDAGSDNAAPSRVTDSGPSIRTSIEGIARSWLLRADSTGNSTLHTTFASTSGRYIHN
jgi:hypothetical protein